MATITSLKPSITELDRHLALQVILNVRKSRFDRKKPLAVERREKKERPARKAREKKVKTAIDKMSVTDKQKLIEQLQKDLGL